MKKLLSLIVCGVVATLLSGCEKKAAQTEMPTESEMATMNTTSTNANVNLASLDMNSQPVQNIEMENTASMDVAADHSSFQGVTTKDVQQALKNAGLYEGAVDGNLGPKTKKAIREFQEKNGLKADGKVGPRTWKKLSAHLDSAQEPTVSAAAGSDTSN